MEHPVVWFEIMGSDAPKLHGFYGELFGWKLQPIPFPGYALMEKVDAGIPGGVGDKATMKGHPGVTFYVGTKDIDASLERATKLGAKVIVPRTSVGPDTTLAMFEDPQGNRVGLVLSTR